MKIFFKFIKNNKGITLIELLIVITLLGVVLAMVTTMIIQALDFVGDGTRRMSAKQLAEINLTEISKYVRNAEEINIVDDDIEIITTDGKSITFENNNMKKDGTIFIHNIEDFKIESKNGSYEITIEKKVDDQKVTVSRKVSPRNSN